MPRIVISYRREDTQHLAGRIYDRLKDEFGSESLFMDIDTIEPGANFVEAIEAAVGSADVLVAVIGSRWLSVTDQKGSRRLDNPLDYVRLEMAIALRRGIRVIPVLADGAQMPREHDLPEDVRRLIVRQALDVSHTRFHTDLDRLVRALQRFDTQEGVAASRREPVVGSEPQPPEEPPKQSFEIASAPPSGRATEPSLSPPSREEEQPARLRFEPDHTRIDEIVAGEGRGPNLASLRERIGASTLLNVDEQNALLVDLKRILRDSETAYDGRTLLEALRRRSDVFATIAEEIDQTLAKETAASQLPPPAFEPSTLPLHQEKSERASGPSTAPAQTASGKDAHEATRQRALGALGGALLGVAFGLLAEAPWGVDGVLAMIMGPGCAIAGTITRGRPRVIGIAVGGGLVGSVVAAPLVGDEFVVIRCLAFGATPGIIVGAIAGSLLLKWRGEVSRS